MKNETLNEIMEAIPPMPPAVRDLTGDLGLVPEMWAICCHILPSRRSAAHTVQLMGAHWNDDILRLIASGGGSEDAEILWGVVGEKCEELARRAKARAEMDAEAERQDREAARRSLRRALQAISAQYADADEEGAE